MKKAIMILFLVLFSSLATAIDTPAKGVLLENPASLGLEKAILVVEKEEQKQLLQNILSKITEQQATKLQGLDDVEIMEDNGNATITGKKTEKLFAFISVKRTVNYLVVEGAVIRQPKFLDFLFRKVE